jgi:hypothetical protein
MAKPLTRELVIELRSLIATKLNLELNERESRELGEFLVSYFSTLMKASSE